MAAQILGMTGLDRRSTTLPLMVRDRLDALDRRVARFGRFGSTAILTAMTVTTVMALHFSVRLVEGLPMQWIAAVNLGTEIAVVTGPIIFYARDVIAKLRASRTKMDEMSRRLIISVEQAESANRAKSAFLANMSHELRTPLNAIMGFSEVMKEQHLGPMNNPRYLSYAGDILASGRYLLGIINDILDLSKIEAGKMTVENAEEFPLRQALEGSLAICAALGEKFGVKIESRLPPENVRLLAVERMIRQIMINLVGNAIKFTPAGGSVTVSGSPRAGGGYAVSVQDSGIGMTAQEIVKALTPFGQVENKMTATHTGTGLGLPLAKAMLELHDGELEISSIPGQGTRVVLNFPAARINPPRKIAAA
ncbi:MAG TPA: ATP-binding protein [Rhizomicrobium sp.]|nr:ATP-binding protein [Rhizomicrobium sp.]